MSGEEVRGFTSDLCQRAILVTYDQLDQAVIERAKLCLLDWIGLAIRGSSEDLAGAIHSLILSGEMSGNASVLGTDIRTNEFFAALANGAQGHAIDFDDTHIPSLTHVSASLLPAILAVAQVNGFSGKQVVSAYVAGVDAQVQIGNYLGPILTERGIHATAILGHIGVAASISNLVGLDLERTEMAVGIASTQAAGLQASFGTMSKPLHPGKAAMDGLIAVRLAANGFTGPKDVIECSNGLFATLLGEFPDLKIPDDWVAGSSVLQVSFKPYPSCALTHPVIDAALHLSHELAGDMSRIESIECFVNPIAAQVAGRAEPTTGLSAKFSIQFCAAVALNNSKLGDRDFVDESLRNENVMSLLRKVRLVPDESISTVQAVVRVVLADGSRIEHRIELAKGNPENPMTKDESLSKFLDVTAASLGQRRGKVIADQCLTIDEMTDVASLFDMQKVIVNPTN